MMTVSLGPATCPLGWTPSPRPRRRWAVKLDFIGSNPDVRPVGQERAETVVSYFRGRPDEWHAGLRTFGRIVYPDLYPGIDLEFICEQGGLVPRLATRPGADLGAVRLRVEGTDAVAVDGDVLRLSTAIGDATWPLLASKGRLSRPRSSHAAHGSSRWPRHFLWRISIRHRPSARCWRQTTTLPTCCTAPSWAGATGTRDRRPFPAGK